MNESMWIEVRSKSVNNGSQTQEKGPRCPTLSGINTSEEIHTLSTVIAGVNFAVTGNKRSQIPGRPGIFPLEEPGNLPLDG